MHRIRFAAAILSITMATPTIAVAAQQSDYSITPFVSFLAATGKTPLAGLDLTVSGNPDLAIRVSGRTALRNTYVGGFGVGTLMPPWGADLDIAVPLSGRPFGSKRSVSTFSFLGFGVAATDTAASRVVKKNWSYGVGTAIPLGSVVDIFADSRWRMQQFVLPTAKPRPTRARELRFGVTFHFGRQGRGWKVEG
jgi:hypothetical protein